MVVWARRAAGAAYRRTIGRFAPPPPPASDADRVELHLGYVEPALPVEIDVEPPVMQRLFARTREQWARLGERDPHWSVLAHDEFRRERLDAEAEARFYETGRANAAALEVFEARAQVRLGRGTCLELGCGVGRITQHLAERFERVIGVDVSPANLEVGRRRLEAHHVRNVELVRAEGLEDLQALPPFDVFFSVIVLQHNSPPVQKAMLEAILPKIRPGGGCLFQTLTRQIGYSFAAAPYLETPVGGMEMHPLPQAAIFDLLRRHQLQLHEVVMDGWAGGYGSYTFFAIR